MGLVVSPVHRTDVLSTQSTSDPDVVNGINESMSFQIIVEYRCSVSRLFENGEDKGRERESERTRELEAR